MSAKEIGACCCAWRVGPGPLDSASRAVANVALEADSNGGFDTRPSHSSHERLLSSTSFCIFLLCSACISCCHFFCSHDLYSFGYACLRPLGVAVSDEALRVQLIDVHLQPLQCVDSLWLCSTLLWSYSCLVDSLVKVDLALGVFELCETLCSALVSLCSHMQEMALPG